MSDADHVAFFSCTELPSQEPMEQLIMMSRSARFGQRDLHDIFIPAMKISIPSSFLLACLLGGRPGLGLFLSAGLFRVCPQVAFKEWPGLGRSSQPGKSTRKSERTRPGAL